MEAALATAISKNLFHNKPLPPSLKILWQINKDRDFEDLFRYVGLLQDNSELEDGYVEVLDVNNNESHARGYREMFKHLGFFGDLDNSDYLAYWLADGTEEPPIIKLDSEGQFTWEGRNLAEVLYRLAEELDEDNAEPARAWLLKHGLEVGQVGELGSTTQFLPDLEKFQENLGDETNITTQPKNTPMDPLDPSTWLLHPGSEVQKLLTDLFGAPPTNFCVWTDGQGLVTSLMMNEAWPKRFPILGIEIGDRRVIVKRKLGLPVETAPVGSIRYQLDDYTALFGFDSANRVKEIYLRTGTT